MAIVLQELKRAHLSYRWVQLQRPDSDVTDTAVAATEAP